MAALEATQPGAPGEELVVRVELRGRSPLALALRDPEERAGSAEELALALGALSTELRCEHLHPPRSISTATAASRTCSARHSRSAAAPRPTRACSTSSRPRVLAGEDSGDPVARRAYLAGLLADLDETLAESLLTEATP